ncbi:acyl-CoA dehydrogenase family protein [Saccharothrix algeriensis]|uniref:Acyl-CoA oxidase n=1 Tax=Saccharothrix algeriensis TaxID=173560 RepID=A0A8T8HWR7_9PSEU|nr:acyl-CoA dehydrogenase family protein [Saccharothrix algeriensis]MBM7814564.1 acyl-CoA oxidase [Saccharothrix algeriensis]QTR02857.1 hypothetical protein J7S33_28200 [Saccharothrix algeriensis]
MATNAGELDPVLFGDRPTARRYRDLFLDPAFRQDWREAVPDPRRRAHERYALLLRELPVTEVATDLDQLVHLHEWAVTVDPHLGALLTVQLNLVLGTLLDHRPRGGEVEEVIREILAGRTAGAYALTELGHGSDLPHLETVAEFDRSTDGFVLRTPTAGAVKFMSSTAQPPLPGVARVGLVLARLLLDGADHGPYLFLVRLVDADGAVRPGVTVRRLPEQPGLGLETALTRFDGVRVGRGCLLSHAGTAVDEGGRLVSPLPADSRVWRAIGRVRWGRLCLAAMAASVSRAALWIAARHAAQRDVAGAGGARLALSALPEHRSGLLDAVAETYAATAAVRTATAAFGRAADEQGASITDLVALTKNYATAVAARVCHEVRDRLGAQGVFTHNRIVEYRALRDAAATAEGDSHVIALQAAHRQLDLQADDWTGPGGSAPPCDVDTPDAWLRWMAARESFLRHRALELRAGDAGDAQQHRDRTWRAALAAAEAQVPHRAARTLAGHGLDRTRDLATLLAVRECRAHGAELLPDGPFPALRRPLPAVVDRLHDRLAGHWPALIDAFGIPDGMLGTPFEAPDGFIAEYARGLHP